MIKQRLTDTEQTIVQSLLRAAIKGDFQPVPACAQWQKIYEWCFCEGIAAIAFDGIQLYLKQTELELPTELKLNWFATSKICEQNYARQERVIHKLQDFYAVHGIRMMLLKGWGFSHLYPIPEHRYSCDVDIYLFGDYKRADKLLTNEMGVKVDASHHHHTVFQLDGVAVENHYDFINVHFERYAPWLENKFKTLALKEHLLAKNGVSLPSPTLHALFMLRHHAQHFAGIKLTLRQLLDWTLYCERYNNQIDWTEIRKCAEYVGMLTFLDGLNECSKALFESEYKFMTVEARRIWQNIWTPSMDAAPAGWKLYPFVLRRWWKGRWKRKMVFRGNMLQQFIVLVHSHLLHPERLIDD